MNSRLDYQPRIIGLTGYARSGKDTTARMIAAWLRTRGMASTTVAFAEPIKRICQDVFGFSDAQVHGSEKEQPDERYPRRPLFSPDGTIQITRDYLTPREAMQKLGTEWGRGCFPDTWIQYAERKITQHLTNGLHVIVTDVRFVNEALALARLDDTEVWRLHRIAEGDGPKPGSHGSEVEIFSLEMTELVTCEIENHSSRGALADQIMARLAALFPDAPLRFPEE